jgi:hypothetical protein
MKRRAAEFSPGGIEADLGMCTNPNLETARTAPIWAHLPVNFQLIKNAFEGDKLAVVPGGRRVVEF